MNIFSLSAHLGLDRSEFESGIQDARASFTDLGDHVADVAKKIAAALALKEAFGALKDLVSAATVAFAEYEQLAGGVETLFGTSADTIKAYAQQAYQTAGMSANEYMSTVTSFAASLIQGVASGTSQATTITKEAADEQYQATKEGYDAQVAAAQEAFAAQYNALKASLDSRYKALQKALNREYNARAKALQKQYEAASQAAEDEIEAYSDSLNKRLEKLQESQEKEVEAFNKATEKKLKAIDREYQATMRRIDKERAARLKLIDDELAALDKEAAEKAKANKEAERETTKQRLQEAVQWAKTVGERVNAQNKLNDYLEQIRIEDEEDARRARIDELKAQRDQVQDEARIEEDAAKKKRDKETNKIRTQREAELKAIQKANKKELRAMQEHNAESLKRFRRAKQAQLRALQEHNQAELENLREGQQNQLEAVQASNARQLANTKKAQQARLKAMKAAHAKQLKELKKALKAQQTAVTATGEITKEQYEQAAEAANQAIQDIADISATFGLPMSRVSETFQSLAKGNYQVLDTLQLGFKGSKEGMQDLMDTAESITGKKYDMSNITDMYEAIHVVIDSMGIAGRAAEEADKTISGSWASTKAAWENLMIAMGRGEGVKEATDNLLESATNTVRNVIPVIRSILPAVGTVVLEAGKKIVEKLPELLGLVSPELEKTANQLFETLPGILEELKKSIQFALGVVQTVWDNTVKPVFDALMGYINETLLPGINKIWVEYVQPLRDKLIDLWDNHLKDIFEKVGAWLGENLPGIIENVMPAVLGAISAFAMLKAAMSIGKIIETVGTGLAGLGGILNVLAANPVAAVIVALGALVGYFVNLYNTNEDFRKKVDTAWAAIKKAVEDFVNWFKTEPAKIWEDVKTGATEAWNDIKTAVYTAYYGISGLWGRITGFFSGIWTDIQTGASEAWNDIKTAIVGDEESGGIVGAVKTKWDELTSFFSTLWTDLQTGASNAWADIQTSFTTAIDAISPYVDGLRTILKGLRDFVVNVFKGDWKNAWTAISTAFKNVFGKIVTAAKTPINKVIGFLNGLISKVRDGLNTIIDFINNAMHIQIPALEFTVPNWVPVVGGNTWGFPGYDWDPGINRIDWSDNTIPKLLAEGGIVKNGGHAIVGEGGYPEYLRVVNGQAIVTPMKGAGTAGTNVTINVYQQPGEDSEALAERIERLIARKEMRRRSAMR